MKLLLLTALLFIVSDCSVLSQYISKRLFEIDSIPAGGILLDKGWKFHAGDSAGWEKPEVDDSNWEAINPSEDIYYLPQVRKAKICWFRLKIKLDSSLTGTPLALVINQCGASEIYLNAKLVKRFGVVSNDYKQLQTYNPRDKPVIFRFTGGAQQAFSIRYALDANTPYLKNTAGKQYNNICFSARIQPPEKALEDYVAPAFASLITWYFQFGVYLLLTVIHLFFFLYYPERKVNLYFAIYTFSEAITFVTGGGDIFSHAITTKFIEGVVFVIAATVTDIFVIVSVYKLFNRPTDIFLRSIIILCILCVPFMFWPYEWGGRSVLISFIISGIGTVRVGVLAIQRRQSGAVIVLIGQTISLLFFIFFSVITISNTSLSSSGLIILQSSITIAFLCPPVFISILLAREFAQTNILLKQQLNEVEKLSRKTIEQEKEKQQILANQNESLEKQVEARTAELKQSLVSLKATQTQLIQTEKMASLGELTAGIAHEIQNPLNFVNNFSEVSVELVDDLKKEATDGNTVEVIAIADDIAENLQKVVHHGKRADAIVKGMLQHSRANTGKKELTDINALADEYLRLSYHGLRAKDKDFNADLKTDFDESIGKIKVVSQDIGRVLLNLYNNAFYAVNEKKRLLDGTFEPTVTVTTNKTGSKVEIVVKDNGQGIPQNIVDKIFQPFFTTKPTGQGTGLGLSLSYDIIKAHGGELRVETKEGEGSEFKIQLPEINI